MDALDDFKKDLISLIGEPTDLRPFVCEGSPLDCKAFIVGLNPATDMSVNFWDFWDSSYGFKKSPWLEAYETKKQNIPPKPRKKGRNRMSNTRSMIKWIVQDAHPIRILETNIFASATEQGVDLAPEQRDAAPFDFLLESIQPRVIVVHGEDAKEYVEEYFLQRKELKPRLIVERHFRF